jgi:UDP-N-acetylmuramoyl-tripeptide--D-alanyl-D-alanine ligase
MIEVMVTRWTAAEMARRISAIPEGESAARVAAVTTDSRKAGEGVAFFAMDGTRHRGMDFVPHAFANGCSVVVVPGAWRGEVTYRSAVLRQDDPRSALGELARSVRSEWDCSVIAVTGSTGKTTVKEMTAHVLGGRAYRSPGNFNTAVGLALSILEIEAPPELAVLEVGASEMGEIGRLAAIVEPRAAAVTNVSAAHLAGFGSVESIRREKLELLRAVPADGLRVVDGDDELLVAAANEIAGGAFRVGFGEANDLRAVPRPTLPTGETPYRLANGLEGVLPVPGTHQVRNALFALAFGEAFGVPLDEGVERLRSFPGVAGRLVILDCGGVTVADDTYNANPASMAAALAWFEGHAAPGRRAVVLGDMLELGTDAGLYHEEVGRRVVELAPDLAIFVGPECRAAFEEGVRRMGDPKGLRHVPDSDEAARRLREWVRPGDFVLVKGSRGMRMERVVQALRGEGDDAV